MKYYIVEVEEGNRMYMVCKTLLKDEAEKIYHECAKTHDTFYLLFIFNSKCSLISV